MRSYIRHPSDIPIEFSKEPVAPPVRRNLYDVSRGGLSFVADTPIQPESLVTIRIAFVEPAFEAQCRVGWCRRQGDRYLIGVEFLHRQDEYRARMVEQICHIEHYKKEVYEQEGRVLSGEQAAREWIRKYAKDFPALTDAALAGTR